MLRTYWELELAGGECQAAVLCSLHFPGMHNHQRSPYYYYYFYYYYW